MVYLGMHCMRLIQHKSKQIKEEEDMYTQITDVEESKNEIQTKTKSKMLKEYEQKMGKSGNKRPLSRIPLWYFLHEILEVERCRDLIEWEDENNLVFTIKKPKDLAVLWGQIKDKETMTYPKLARGIRYYYGKGVIEKFNGKRFCYKFVVSKKTKAVLSKRKNIPTEIEIPVLEKKSKNISKKRKLSSNDNMPVLLAPKRRRERTSTDCSTDSNDQPSVCGSDWGSDEDDSFSESDWGSLDACLAEIFADPLRMGAIFDTKTTSEDNTTFIMNSSPPELTSMPPLDYVQQSTTTLESRLKELTETPQALDIYDIYEQLQNESMNQSNNNTNYNNIYSTNTLNNDRLTTNNFTDWKIPTSKNIRKKSRSESENIGYTNDPFSVYIPPTNAPERNNINSLPDFNSFQTACLYEDSPNYFTNILLEQNSAFIQDMALETGIFDNVLQL